MVTISYFSLTQDIQTFTYQSQLKEENLKKSSFTKKKNVNEVKIITRDTASSISKSRHFKRHSSFKVLRPI